MLPRENQKISKSGLFKGFIDCHCHILPGVDDGFRTIEDSLSVYEVFAEAGIAEVWSTLHLMENVPNEQEELRFRFEKLSQACNSPVSLHMFSENDLGGLFNERIADGEILHLMDKLLLMKHLISSLPLIWMKCPSISNPGD